MSMIRTPRTAWTRRDLLRGSAGLAALVVAGCAASTRSAARHQRILGANERIRVGLIGCGGLGAGYHIPRLRQMSGDPKINIELGAVCDIYEPRKQRAAALSGAPVYHDYRRMLDEAGLDAVVIATPDHWHARMSLDALEAGLDVHVEKPMCLYWEEAREVCRTAERLGRVVQVGAEGTSLDVFWQARRLIAEGRIGKPVWVTGGVYRNDPAGDWNTPIDPDCSPANLDWNAFLGPAPRRPFDPERYFRYRKYWDYSGGVAHDLISHVLSAAQICLGPEFPARVSAAGGIYVHHDRETPDTFSMQVEYPSGYLATMFCTQTSSRGPELIIRGDRAAIRFSHPEGGVSTHLFVEPEPPYAADTPPQKVFAQPRPDHDENFFECMRTRARPYCDALTGYKVMVALGLAVRSYREGRTFTFDPVHETVRG